MDGRSRFDLSKCISNIHLPADSKAMPSITLHIDPAGTIIPCSASNHVSNCIPTCAAVNKLGPNALGLSDSGSKPGPNALGLNDSGSKPGPNAFGLSAVNNPGPNALGLSASGSTPCSVGWSVGVTKELVCVGLARHDGNCWIGTVNVEENLCRVEVHGKPHALRDYYVSCFKTIFFLIFNIFQLSNHYSSCKLLRQISFR